MRRLVALFPLAALFAAAPPASLHGQVLHTNDRWDDCAMVIDPSLTQAAWHQFVAELGVVTYYRPLASARPLGRGHFEVALLQWATRIDDADAAWNDTFSHPDSTHWLFEGDALPIPGLMLRAGVTDRVDAGVYLTKNTNSNYGIVGTQLQYGLLQAADGKLAVSGRGSATWLFGPEDLSASVYGLDLVASRDVWRVSPYAGVSGYLARGRERTSKVALDDENVFGVQGMLGVTASLSALRLGAEYYLGRVPGYSLKVAIGR